MPPQLVRKLVLASIVVLLGAAGCAHRPGPMAHGGPGAGMGSGTGLAPGHNLHMQHQMNMMEQMRGRMAAARTDAERQALMAEHMTMMQSMMQMMMQRMDAMPPR